MRIEYFVFTLFVILSFWLTPKISLARHSNLSVPEIRSLLAFKILVSLSCAWYLLEFSSHLDYSSNSREGKVQYNLLLNNPWLFFTDFRQDADLYGYGGLFDSKDSFWAYLRFNVLYKITAIINLLTRGNFYLNTVIFSNLVFFGHLAFYRIYTRIYKGQKKLALVACFCIPSLLLYTSCIHKDGMVFLCLGLLGYCFYRLLSGNIKLKYLFVLSVSALFIFLFRNYVIVALLPAMLVALLCRLIPMKKWVVFIGTYLLFIVLFFGSSFFTNSFNLPAAVVQRKVDFAGLEGGKTNIQMNELNPTIKSFGKNLPQALNHSLFRPYVWEFSKPDVMLAALELLLYQFIVACFIFFKKERIQTPNDFNIFGIAFFLNMMVIIGYTIPNIGAFVRYRSIFWIFIICPILCHIDWKRILHLLRPGKSIN